MILPTRKQKRSIWFRVFVIAIALMILAAIAFARAGYCSIPNELGFNDEFRESVRSYQHSAGALAWLLYYEASRQLAWHGASDIQILDFAEVCQVDDCSVHGIWLLMQFEHPAICSWASSRFNHTFVSVDIDDIAAPQADVSITVIREGHRGYQPLPYRFIDEINQLRETAQASVSPAEWERYSTLRFGYHWWFGGEWDVYVSTMHRTQLHSLDIEHPRKSCGSK